jgi:L-idonate 5-dehydrogenase
MTRACRLHAKLDLRVEDIDSAALGEHDVEVRLGAGGICGSDLHYWREGRVGAFVLREPLVPGHEAAGTVQRTGASVTRVKPGDKVAVNPSHACGRCERCREGRLNLCERMFFLGSASVFPHAQGLFRETFVIDAAQLTPVHEDITLAELACAEPLSIGLHAVQRAGELLGRRVLVAGAGTIGCMCTIAARLAGAAEVTVVDIAERPRATARAVGADRALRGDQLAPGELAEHFDVAIEAAGSPAALATCLAGVRRGGRIVQVGTLPPEAIPFPANQVMARELDYVGAFRAAQAFERAVQALRTRRVDVRPLLSAALPLSRAQEAFELAADRSRSTKVQLIPD